MTVDEQRIVRLYEAARRALGHEEAATLMEELRRWQQLASRADVDAARAELGGEIARLEGTVHHLAAELRGEMGQLSIGLRAEMQQLSIGLRAEMQQLGTELRAEMQQLGTELRGEMEHLGTDLRGEMGLLRADLLGEMHRLETRMLRWLAPSVVAGMAAAAAIAGLG